MGRRDRHARVRCLPRGGAGREAARRLRGHRRVERGGIGRGEGVAAPGARRERPGAVPGLRLREGIGLRHRAAIDAPRVPGQLRIHIRYPRRCRPQRPAVQARRCERRERLVGAASGIPVSARMAADALQEAAYRICLGSIARSHACAERIAGTRRGVRTPRRQGDGLLRSTRVARAAGAGREPCRAPRFGELERGGIAAFLRRRWLALQRLAQRSRFRRRADPFARPRSRA